MLIRKSGTAEELGQRAVCNPAEPCQLEACQEGTGMQFTMPNAGNLSFDYSSARHPHCGLALLLAAAAATLSAGTFWGHCLLFATSPSHLHHCLISTS